MGKRILGAMLGLAGLAGLVGACESTPPKHIGVIEGRIAKIDVPTRNKGSARMLIETPDGEKVAVYFTGYCGSDNWAIVNLYSVGEKVKVSVSECKRGFGLYGKITWDNVDRNKQ